MRSRGSKKVIYVAIAANLAIASFKYVAATFTKSSQWQKRYTLQWMPETSCCFFWE